MGVCTVIKDYKGSFPGKPASKVKVDKNVLEKMRAIDVNQVDLSALTPELR